MFGDMKFFESSQRCWEREILVETRLVRSGSSQIKKYRLWTSNEGPGQKVFRDQWQKDRGIEQPNAGD